MITLLTIEEELELINRIRKRRCEADQAKELLAKSYLRFIYSVAKKYNHLSLNLQELIVSGITGLIKAFEKYDEIRGFKFTSSKHQIQSAKNALWKKLPYCDSTKGTNCYTERNCYRNS